MALEKDIAAFANAMGFGNPEIVLAFSSIPWDSKEDRNQFINELVQINGGKLLGGSE